MSRYRFDHENDGPDDVYESEYSGYGPSMEPLSEDQRIELWHLSQFDKMEFSGEQIALLLRWGIEPADVRPLLYRDGIRTSCTHEQALAILDRSPVLV